MRQNNGDKGMRGRKEIYAASQFFGRRIDLTFIHRDPEDRGRLKVATTSFPATFEDESSTFDPTVTLRIEEAQQLMDELWKCGVRPTEGSGSAGSLAATERHLKDMQAIAFGLLKGHGVANG
jgi:hypothetical protein